VENKPDEMRYNKGKINKISKNLSFSGSCLLDIVSLYFEICIVLKMKE